jgi:WD40 repeat protein
VTGSGDLTAKLWDAGSLRLRLTLAGHHGDVRAIAFNHRGTSLATAGSDSNIKLWDLSDGTCRRTLRGHPDGVHVVAFSYDDRLLASGGVAGHVGKLWDVASGRDVATLLTNGPGVLSLAFGTDGRTLISGDDRGVAQVWHIASSQETDSLILKGVISSIAISPDGRLMAMAAEDVVRVWVLPAATTGSDR